MNKLTALCLSVALLAGCASDLRTKGYRAFAGYVIAEETAAGIVTDKTVPARVVVKIQESVKVTAPVAEALYKDLLRFAQLQDEIKAIRDAGGDPSQARMAEMDAATQALKDSYGLSRNAIAALIETVNTFKRGDN